MPRRTLILLQYFPACTPFERIMEGKALSVPVSIVIEKMVYLFDLVKPAVLSFGLMFTAASLAADLDASSSQALRELPPVSNRPLPGGTLIHVDPVKGHDDASGTEREPLRTVGRALQLVGPGGTVCLRGGVYYENVYVAAVGRDDAPITIRSYPGERAVIDGGIEAFYRSSQEAWRPVSSDEGVEGEYESVQTYRHVYQPIGSFGDSMIGLQTYYHAMDLRADQELVHYDDPSKRREVDHAPLYCGPGLWFNAETGRIHVRLAHTALDGVVNYRGATDPRRLPLVIAPFRSVPLTIEGAEHVVFQDLVVRGGGYDTVRLNLANHVTFENVVIWAGTYGIRAQGTQHLRMLDCAVHGNIPPWAFRSDTSKRDYPGRPHRNITRLNTHALLVPDAGREFSVYATPVNDHWEIAHSVWTDAHDGLYLGGINARFHNNLVENMQDDGVYLSPMYPRHVYARDWATVYVYQNLFRQVNMPIAFGGLDRKSDMQDVIYIYRNIFDQRLPLNYGRPTTQNPERRFWAGVFMSDHGSPPWPAMYIYHNTLISGGQQRHAHLGLVNSAHPDRPRRVFNNILVHLQNLPNYPINLDPAANAYADANLFWSPNLTAEREREFFRRFRASGHFKDSKAVHPPGFGANAKLADPRFERLETDGEVENDYRLRSDSPAVDAGLDLPEAWPDPLRDADAGRPDLGALPVGAAMPAPGPRVDE